MLEVVKFLPSMLEEATAYVGISGKFIKFGSELECLFNSSIIKALDDLKKSVIWGTFHRVGNSHAERRLFGENACTVVENEVDLEYNGIKQTVTVRLSIPYVSETVILQKLREVKRKHEEKDSIERKFGFVFCDISGVELIVGDVDSYNALLKAVEDEYIPF